MGSTFFKCFLFMYSFIAALLSCVFDVVQMCREHGLCRSRHIVIPVRLEMGSSTSEGIDYGHKIHECK